MQPPNFIPLPTCMEASRLNLKTTWDGELGSAFPILPLRFPRPLLSFPTGGVLPAWPLHLLPFAARVPLQKVQDAKSRAPRPKAPPLPLGCTHRSAEQPEGCVHPASHLPQITR